MSNKNYTLDEMLAMDLPDANSPSFDELMSLELPVEKPRGELEQEPQDVERLQIEGAKTLSPQQQAAVERGKAAFEPDAVLQTQEASNVESFKAGVADTVTFGLIDEIAASAETIFTGGFKNFGKRYKDNLAYARNAKKTLEENKLAHGAGMVAGLMVPAGAGSLLIKGGTKGGQIATKIAQRVGMGKVGQATSALIGRGLGETVASQLPREALQLATGEQTLEQTKKEVLAGGAVDVGAELILGSAAPLIKRGLQRKMLKRSAKAAQDTFRKIASEDPLADQILKEFDYNRIKALPNVNNPEQALKTKMQAFNIKQSQARDSLEKELSTGIDYFKDEAEHAKAYFDDTVQNLNILAEEGVASAQDARNYTGLVEEMMGNFAGMRKGINEQFKQLKDTVIEEVERTTKERVSIPVEDKQVLLDTLMEQGILNSDTYTLNMQVLKDRLVGRPPAALKEAEENLTRFLATVSEDGLSFKEAANLSSYLYALADFSSPSDPIAKFSEAMRRSMKDVDTTGIYDNFTGEYIRLRRVLDTAKKVVSPKASPGFRGVDMVDKLTRNYKKSNAFTAENSGLMGDFIELDNLKRFELPLEKAARDNFKETSNALRDRAVKLQLANPARREKVMKDLVAGKVMNDNQLEALNSLVGEQLNITELRKAYRASSLPSVVKRALDNPNIKSYQTAAAKAMKESGYDVATFKKLQASVAKLQRTQKLPNQITTIRTAFDKAGAPQEHVDAIEAFVKMFPKAAHLMDEALLKQIAGGELVEKSGQSGAAIAGDMAEIALIPKGLEPVWAVVKGSYGVIKMLRNKKKLKNALETHAKKTKLFRELGAKNSDEAAAILTRNFDIFRDTFGPIYNLVTDKETQTDNLP